MQKVRNLRILWKRARGIQRENVVQSEKKTASCRKIWDYAFDFRGV